MHVAATTDMTLLTSRELCSGILDLITMIKSAEDRYTPQLVLINDISSSFDDARHDLAFTELRRDDSSLLKWRIKGAVLALFELIPI